MRHSHCRQEPGFNTMLKKSCDPACCAAAAQPGPACCAAAPGPPAATFAFLLSSLDAGLKSLDVSVSSQASPEHGMNRMKSGSGGCGWDGLSCTIALPLGAAHAAHTARRMPAITAVCAEPACPVMLLSRADSRARPLHACLPCAVRGGGGQPGRLLLQAHAKQRQPHSSSSSEYHASSDTRTQLYSPHSPAGRPRRLPARNASSHSTLATTSARIC